MKKKTLAQSSAEYTILIALVAAAILSIQIYLKRGVQGKVKDLADQISAEHYEQDTTIANYTTEQKGKTVYRYEDGIAKTYQDPNIDSESREDVVTRRGYETVSPEYQ